MCSIAAVLRNQGKHDAALILYSEVLRVRVATLGSEHLDVGDTKHKCG